MPALRRRTVFATPFIAIVGCGGAQTRPEEKTIAGETWNVSARDGACEADAVEGPCPKGALCNPPPPREIECPAGIADTRVQVVKKPDQTCAVVPPGCVELACATQATPCPLPFDAPRRLRGPLWTVSKTDAGCVAVAGDQTRAIRCPPGDAVRIGQLSSGCAVIPDGCRDESCAGEQMPCPMPAGKDLPALTWDIARTGNACTATTRGPIAGERTFKFVCPEQTTFPPRFQIRRQDATAPCELFVGTGPGVPTACPES